MSIFQKSRSRASSRQQINIRGTKDGVILLPGNKYRIAMEVSTTNFDLMSDTEQDSIILAYQSFINSLPCPIQIITRSRALDVTDYVDDIQSKKGQTNKDVYKDQIDNYCEFVQELVADHHILIKNFYIIAILDSSGYDFEEAKERLNLYGDLIKKGLSRIGLKSRQLNSVEYLELFYSLYNSDRAKSQPISKELASFISSQFSEGKL